MPTPYPNTQQSPRTYAVGVTIEKLPLSQRSVNALQECDRYDWILFTSSNAVHCFVEVLKKNKVQQPHAPRVAAVGATTAMTLRSYDFRVDIIPEKETVDSMVKTLGSVRGMRILFPRSAIAPSDVVRMLRASGAVVTVMPLYTSSPAPLSANEKRKILTGIYTTLFFKSPSGVRGLLSHFTKIEALAVRARTAQCIGPTTARAARAAGFAKVSLQPGMHY